MSIKYKIPFITLALFIINLILILIFYKFYITKKIENNFDFAWQAISVAANDISSTIDGKDYDDALSYLSSLENKNNLVFTLENVKSGEKTIINANIVYAPSFTQTKIILLSNKQYLFSMQKNIDLLNLGSHSIIKVLIYFECIILFILFFLVGILLHLCYVKPLISLGNNMDKYTSGQTIPMPVRKDEIGWLQNNFSKLSYSLYAEKQIQNRIIASISHDIKTPLTSVLGYTERMLKKDFNEHTKKRYLTTIYNQATDISSIVEEFDEYLSCTLPSSEQMKVYKVSYITKMLDDEYKFALSEKNIYFTAENYCDDNISISADLLKLRRVFANIISNSIRHAKANKLQISFKATLENKFVNFIFTDNGNGIDAKELTHIFEPFYTSDQSRKISGLGLSICKNIIESQNGTIEAKNDIPKGISVIIKIPKYDN